MYSSLNKVSLLDKTIAAVRICLIVVLWLDATGQLNLLLIALSGIFMLIDTFSKENLMKPSFRSKQNTTIIQDITSRLILIEAIQFSSHQLIGFYNILSLIRSTLYLLRMYSQSKFEGTLSQSSFKLLCQQETICSLLELCLFNCEKKFLELRHQQGELFTVLTLICFISYELYRGTIECPLVRISRKDLIYLCSILGLMIYFESGSFLQIVVIILLYSIRYKLSQIHVKEIDLTFENENVLSPFLILKKTLGELDQLLPNSVTDIHLNFHNFFAELDCSHDSLHLITQLIELFARSQAHLQNVNFKFQLLKVSREQSDIVQGSFFTEFLQLIDKKVQLDYYCRSKYLLKSENQLWVEKNYLFTNQLKTIQTYRKARFPFEKSVPIFKGKYMILTDSNLLHIIMFQKLIKPNMINSPSQILFDLFMEI